MGILSKIFTWWDGATVGTALFSALKGEQVGTDAQGNTYYRSNAKTADGLERVTKALNTGDMKQTVDSLTQYARNHPALFLGLSVAAGFALARVGKTAMEGAHVSDMERPGTGRGPVDEAVAPYAPMSEV